MMNAKLRELAAQCMLASPRREQVALAFACECVARARHLFELPEAFVLFERLQAAVRDEVPLEQLAGAAEQAAALARSHQGSASIDGSGHSAVTATHALARALAGRAIDAAEYSAYALVYSYGRYAVADAGSFDTEFEWQLGRLRALCGVTSTAMPPAR